MDEVVQNPMTFGMPTIVTQKQYLHVSSQVAQANNVIHVTFDT